MIVLPITTEEVSQLRIDEAILRVLIRSRNPLSVNELTTRVNSQGVKKHLPRAVRRCVNDLHEKKIVDRIKGGKLFTFTINMRALQEGIQFAEKFVQENSMFKAIRDAKHEHAFTKTFTFQDLKEVDNFIDEFELFWIDNLRKDEKIILYEQQYNRQCLSEPVTDSSVFQEEGITHYILCRDKRFVKRKREGRWSCRNAYIRVGVPLTHNWDTVVMGDYILTVTYPEGVLQEIEDVFGKVTSESVVRRLWDIRGEIVVTIQKNAQLAQVVCENAARKFPGELQGLVDELKEQKRSGAELHVGLKWYFVLPEQVDILTDPNHASTIHDKNAPWMLTDKQTEVMSKHIDQITDSFSSEKPISVIDLGPGPCIKTVILLNRMDSKFANIQYLAFDYSEEILLRAQRDSDQYMPHVIDKEFIQGDFQELKGSPQKLLDKVSNEQRIYLFIGSTYGSFDPEQTQQFLKAILKPGDCFVIDAESLDTKEEFEEIRHRYNNEAYRQHTMLALYELGFTKSDFLIGYEFNEEDWSVEGTVTLRNVPESLLPDTRAINLQKGDRIRFFRNRKPRMEHLEKELKSLGNVELTLKKGEGNSRHLVAFGRMLPQYF